MIDWIGWARAVLYRRSAYLDGCPVGQVDLAHVTGFCSRWHVEGEDAIAGHPARNPSASQVSLGPTLPNQQRGVVVGVMELLKVHKVVAPQS